MEQTIKEYLNINAPKYAEFKGYNEDFIKAVNDFTEGAEPTEQVQQYYNEAIDAVRKFQEGGNIPKFQQGGIPEWYLKLYKQKELTGWTPELDASLAGENLNKNKLHHKYKDLTGAYNSNQAYTSNQNIIGQDLNTFYNSDYKGNSLADFVTNYNKNAGIIRSRWDREDITYGKDDAREHNQLFRRMFTNRSGSTENPYDLGYSESTEPIQGSTTWMRRMDRYEKKWQDLTDEEKKNRIHKIGDLGYVYKEDNGDIGIVDDDTLKKLGLNISAKPASPDVQIKTNLQSGMPTVGITKNPLRALKSPNNWLPDIFETIKFFDSYNTNKRMRDLFQNNYKYATEEYRPKHLNIYGDLAALNQNYNEAANLQRKANVLGNNTSDYRTASAINLQGQQQAEQGRAQGRKAYNDLVRTTSDRALQLEFENIDKEQAVANENFGRGIAAHNVRMNNILEYMNQQHANRKDYLNYWETKVAQVNQDRKQFMAKILESQMDRALENDPELLQAQKNYTEAKTREEKDSAYNNFIELKRRKSREILPIYYEQLASLKGFKYNPNNNPFIMYKKGGTISDDGPVRKRSKDLERHRKKRRDDLLSNDKKLDRLGRLTYLWAKRAQGKK